MEYFKNSRKNYMIEYISIILSEKINNSINLDELLLLLPKRTNHLNIKNNNKKEKYSKLYVEIIMELLIILLKMKQILN